MGSLYGSGQVLEQKVSLKSQHKPPAYLWGVAGGKDGQEEPCRGPQGMWAGGELPAEFMDLRVSWRTVAYAEGGLQHLVKMLSCEER